MARAVEPRHDGHKDLHSEHGALRGEHPGRVKDPIIRIADIAWLEFDKPDLVRAEAFARALLDQPEVEAIGLGARDSLRLEAGLPEDVPFIQKTGTQLERACHVGVIEPQDERRAIVVVACANRNDMMIAIA